MTGGGANWCSPDNVRGRSCGGSRWRRRPAALRVHEGQVYLATDDDRLEQIDLQTGRSTARLKFSQKIVGPCAVSSSGDRLYLPGHENVLYVLTRRPLACEQVVWLGTLRERLPPRPS